MDNLDVQEPLAAPESPDEDRRASESEKAHVTRIIATIRADKLYHEPAFKKMRRDMHVATYGADPDWPADSYRANIAGRHIKQKTNALYAKNPRAVAKRAPRLDYAIWDENPASLMTALELVQAGHEVMMQGGADVVGMDGQPVEPVPGFAEAQALVEDFQQGTARRDLIRKIGRTLEILYEHSLREQQPLPFKPMAKKLVRRACTTGVGYVEVGFQRETGPRAGLVDQMADARARLDHLRRLMEEVSEGEIDGADAEVDELERSLQALEFEPEIVLREGLVLDFPQSTKVIPDKMCQSLAGFIGSRHLTLEYHYTIDEAEELFPGVDLKARYTGYSVEGSPNEVPEEPGFDFNEDDQVRPAAERSGGLVCVWKYYDKPSGLVYYVADGYDRFLREPAPPDVFSETFWPVLALTFNEVENEKDLFPPSDVELVLHPQREHNRSRQGMREHRHAARPRWVAAKGALDDEAADSLSKLNPFETAFINKEPDVSIGDMVEAIPVPGVDPNLYETNQFMTDIQVAVGTQEAVFGGVAKATATESAIAANATAATDGSGVDDLDSFLTMLARMSGQVLMREMSEEQVQRIVGPGAVWPQMTLSDIAEELYLEVQAGSSGKPNQAVEIQNWQQMLPFLLQMPGVSPNWLARESIRRLDDSADLTEAIVEDLPSVVSQNRGAQAATGDPTTNPTDQGDIGADNGPQPPGLTGSGPEFGSNQV